MSWIIRVGSSTSTEGRSAVANGGAVCRVTATARHTVAQLSGATPNAARSVSDAERLWQNVVSTLVGI